jgi:hypothetical protein
LGISNINYQFFKDIITRVIFFARSAEEDGQIFFILNQKLQDFLRHLDPEL